MKVTYSKLKLIFGESRARTINAALRRENLGECRMVTVYTKNRYKSNIKTLRSDIHFDIDKSIVVIKAKIEKAYSNVYRIPNPVWVKGWNRLIKDLEKVKGGIV